MVRAILRLRQPSCSADGAAVAWLFAYGKYKRESGRPSDFANSGCANSSLMGLDEFVDCHELFTGEVLLETQNWWEPIVH